MSHSGSRHDRDEPASPSLERLKDELRAAATIQDQTERLLEVAAIVAISVADLDLEPVVVGGLAVAYWSDSEFVTADIDLLIPRLPQLSSRLEAIGFVRDGRHWILAGSPILLEAPGEALEPGDEAESVELSSGRRVRVLSLEDLLLWRLREWVHWHGAGGFHQAAHLVRTEGLDHERLDRRAAAEGLSRALAELKRVVAEIEGGKSFEAWELREIGERLERELQ